MWQHAQRHRLLQLHGSVRGYKSDKRPLKPMSTAASWTAVEPFLPPAPSSGDGSTQRRRQAAPIVDSCVPEVPEVPKPEVHVQVGVIGGQYSLDLQAVFAAVEIGGTHFKVTRDDVLFVNQLHGVEVNDVLELGRVMLLGSQAKTVIGRPYIPGASVLVAVEEHFRDGKVHVFKRKRRKRNRRYMTARPHLTTLRVLEVRGLAPAGGSKDASKEPLPILWGAPSGSGMVLQEGDDGDGEEEEEDAGGARQQVQA
ncbi:hypothetical protein FOA52_005286 [Chlamydomonas sp. UWO 241]|nr:hypothetical protein FOA52_005286 [Chlamydomonas sp. UWO 241]